MFKYLTQALICYIFRKISIFGFALWGIQTIYNLIFIKISKDTWDEPTPVLSTTAGQFSYWMDPDSCASYPRTAPGPVKYWKVELSKDDLMLSSLPVGWWWAWSEECLVPGWQYQHHLSKSFLCTHTQPPDFIFMTFACTC